MWNIIVLCKLYKDPKIISKKEMDLVLNKILKL